MRNKLGLYLATCCLLSISCDDDNGNVVRKGFFKQGLGVTDVDGNKYASIILNEGLLQGKDAQEWMTSNLRTTKYSNGDPIPNVTDDSWPDLTTGAWCYYNNNPAMDEAYGKLYNGYAAADSRNICPAGWRLPSSFELYMLATFLGGEEVAGGALKEAGTDHWVTPNSGASDSTGLSFLPGGHREGYIYDYFDKAGRLGRYWADEHLHGNANNFYELSNENSKLAYGGTIVSGYGFSCRCIKD